MKRIPRKYLVAAAAGAGQVAAAAIWGLVGAVVFMGLLLVALITLTLIVRWDVRRAGNRTLAAARDASAEVLAQSDELRADLRAELSGLRSTAGKIDDLLAFSGRIRQDAQLRHDSALKEQRELRKTIEGQQLRIEKLEGLLSKSAKALTSLEQQVELLRHTEREQVLKVHKVLTEVRGWQQGDGDRWRGRRTGLLHELEALLNLHQLVEVRGGLPPSGGWALDPSVLLVVIHRVLIDKPRLVVELGSGTSTVWLGYAAKANGGRTKIVTLEHDPLYADLARKRLREHECDDHVEIRLAPLVPVRVDGESWTWYDPAGWQSLQDIEMLVVDGPPARTQALARYPAVPLLHPLLAESAHILLDDFNRDDEQELLEKWLERYADLEHVEGIRMEAAALLSRRTDLGVAAAGAS